MPTLSYLVFCVHYKQHLLSPLINAPIFFAPILGNYTFLDFLLSHSLECSGQINIYTNEDLTDTFPHMLRGWVSRGLEIISEHSGEFDLRRYVSKASGLKSDVVLTLDSEFPLYMPVNSLLKKFLKSKKDTALIKKKDKTIGVFFTQKSFKHVVKNFNSGTFNFRSLLSYIEQHERYENLEDDGICLYSFNSLKDYIFLNFNLMNPPASSPTVSSLFLNRYLYPGTVNDEITYIRESGEVKSSLLGMGSQIEGKITNCIIGCGVRVKKNAVLEDSIALNNVTIERDCEFYNCLLGEHLPKSPPTSPPKSIFGSIADDYVILGKNTNFTHKVKVDAGVIIQDNQVVNKKSISKGMNI